MSAARVTVLMATFNGLEWLPEQVASILDQRGVQVRLVVSDDHSTDGTARWLDDLAAGDHRVSVLPPREEVDGDGAHAATGNFLRLLRDVEIDPGGFVALADQDDVWLPDKLAGQVRVLQAGADGTSSDVEAFRADGSTFLVRKSYPQRRWDWVCESPGPGCSFLLTPRLVELVRDAVADPASGAARVAFHDWLVYGLCRARGWKWVITEGATLRYRQHEQNTFGANQGLRQKLTRVRLLNSSWHRDEALLVTRAGLTVTPPDQRAALAQLAGLLADRGPRARLALARTAPLLRRRPRDAAVLAALIAAGIW